MLPVSDLLILTAVFYWGWSLEVAVMCRGARNRKVIAQTHAAKTSRQAVQQDGECGMLGSNCTFILATSHVSY